MTDGGINLVTGGAGFIGSHLVDLLLETGGRVTVVDDLSTGSLANLESAMATAPDRIEILEGRVSDVLPGLDGSRFGRTFHLAAAVGVRLVVDEPIRTIETNVHETSAVLEFARRGSVPTLIASTSEVYGKGTRTPFAEGDDVVYGPTRRPDGLTHAQRRLMSISPSRTTVRVSPRRWWCDFSTRLALDNRANTAWCFPDLWKRPWKGVRSRCMEMGSRRDVFVMFEMRSQPCPNCSQTPRTMVGFLILGVPS